MKNAIKEYYEDNFNTNIDVNLTMYDVNGTETTEEANATSYVYHVVLRELIEGMSVTSISVVKASTSATITIDLPTDVQLSAEPLRGKYRVKCVDHENFTSYSNDLHRNWFWNTNWIAEHIS